MKITFEMMRTGNRLFALLCYDLLPMSTLTEMEKDSTKVVDLKKCPYDLLVDRDRHFMCRVKKDYLSLGTNDKGEILKVRSDSIDFIQEISRDFIRDYGINLKTPQSKKYEGIRIENTHSTLVYENADPNLPNVGTFPFTLNTKEKTVSFKNKTKERHFDRVKSKEIRKRLRIMLNLLDGYALIGNYPEYENFDIGKLPSIEHAKLNRHYLSTKRIYACFLMSEDPAEILSLAFSAYLAHIPYYSDSIKTKKARAAIQIRETLEYALKTPEDLFRVVGVIKYK